MASLLVEISVKTETVVRDICALPWSNLTMDEMISVAWGYYFFSVQFRENLELACQYFPEDGNLVRLKSEECRTSNLSPYPGVAAVDEALDHDEFMLRALRLAPVSEVARLRFITTGDRYLKQVRSINPMTRALSIASYEDGGLERTFRAILTAPAFDNPTLNAFRFFLNQHILFDSDPEAGHGHLSRKLPPDESVVQLWLAFKQLFLDFAPRLADSNVMCGANVYG